MGAGCAKRQMVAHGSTGFPSSRGSLGLHWCNIDVEELQEFHTVAEGFHRVIECCRGL